LHQPTWTEAVPVAEVAATLNRPWIVDTSAPRTAPAKQQLRYAEKGQRKSTSIAWLDNWDTWFYAQETHLDVEVSRR